MEYRYQAESGPIVFSAHAGSHINRKRENQDNYLILLPQLARSRQEKISVSDRPDIFRDWPEYMIRLAVADGMGGHQNGKEIADMTINELMNCPPNETEKDMADSVKKIHYSLFERFHINETHSPGTTLIIADINFITLNMVIAHIGDSRIYRVHPDRKVEQLTFDHTFDEFDYRDGDLDPAVYAERLHKKQAGIVQALGFGSFGLLKESDGYKPNRIAKNLRLDRAVDLPDELSSHADIQTLNLNFEKSFMIATDGLWHNQENDQWSGPISDRFVSKKEVDLQITTAMDKGSQDNISLIVFGIEKLRDKITCR